MAERVLFIGLDLYSLGGIQRLSRHALAALGQTNTDVCSLRPPVATGLGLDIAVCVTGSEGARAFRRDVRSLARSERPALVVCDHVTLAPLARSAARAAGGVYAVTVHAIEVWRMLPPRHRRALLQAERVLSVCHFTEQLLTKRHPSLEGRVAVTGACVDVDRFTPGEVDATRRAEASERPVVLTVSRLAPGRPKGHERVLEALAELSASGLPFTYLVAGDGPDRARLERRAQDLGVRDLVTFLGTVDEEELARLYLRCDVFVLASGFRLGWRRCQGEAMGLVSLEAQASARPVITSRLDGSAEAIADGETGLLVDPGDSADVARALRTLLTDTPLRERMGRAGRAFAVAQASPEAFARRYRRALEPWLTAAPAPERAAS